MPKLMQTRLGLLSVLLLAAGCASNRQPVTCGSLAANGDIVFVADGSGDYRTTSKALYEATRACGTPLRVETFVWSHGYGRMLADHVDHCNHLEEGRRLAAFIVAAKQSCPEHGVYLVAHSSGSAVVLAAAEASPPGCIERIVLLAPAVACDYDLRPALRSVRQSIDVFTSRRDIGALAFGTGVAGTADRRWTAASGRVGFTPIVSCPGDELLYTKLRMHPWDRCVVWSGNRGSHYGTLEQRFMRAYVLPLLSRSP
ncbi:MAG: serine aminopeptidase domain-containing protein [Gemmataceae bacterium]